MGNCVACEKMDDSLFWRWEESPIDEPPSIEPLSTATRRATPDSGAPTAFPTPIVSIQNAPTAPDPAGIAPVLDAITKQSFADITGLEGTQANAAAAYAKAMDTAATFGKEASTLAQQAAMLGAKDKTMGAIDDAESGGKIDAKDARDLRVKALRKMVGDGATDERASSVSDRLKVIDDAEAKGSITKEQAADLRGHVLRGLDPEEAARNEEQAATNETIRKIPEDQVESVETKQPSGKTTKVTARPSTPRGVAVMLTARNADSSIFEGQWSLELRHIATDRSFIVGLETGRDLGLDRQRALIKDMPPGEYAITGRVLREPPKSVNVSGDLALVGGSSFNLSVPFELDLTAQEWFTPSGDFTLERGQQVVQLLATPTVEKTTKQATIKLDAGLQFEEEVRADVTAKLEPKLAVLKIGELEASAGATVSSAQSFGAGQETTFTVTYAVLKGIQIGPLHPPK